MFYYSTKTKKRVLHLKNCHHIKAIKKENVATVSSVVEAQKKGIGTTVCKCCSALRKDYSRNLNEILNFAYSNGMCCHMDEGLMRIESSFAKWIIIPQSNGYSYELHHQNTRKSNHDNSLAGYHYQHIGGRTVRDILEYIAEHDKYRKINPVTLKPGKAPPKKGTRRWASLQRRIKKKERKQQIRNVLDLIDSLAI